MQDNSELFPYTDIYNPGDCYMGINFRFGTSTGWKYVRKYLCKGGKRKYCDPYADACTCSDWADDTNTCLVKWLIESKWGGNVNSLIDGVNCNCFSPPQPAPPPDCMTAECIEQPAGCGKWGRYKCTCSEYARYCSAWACYEDIGDGVDGCTCEFDSISEVDRNAPNWVNRNIPIGIRSLKADNSYYMFSVCPGGNWIGTVRGE